MLLCKYRLKKLRRVVLGIRGVGYDLGLGAPEVSIPVNPSGPQLLHHVISRFSFLWNQESNSCFASVLGNWEFFLSLVQFIFLSTLSIHLRFDHTIVCSINPFLMEQYFWTLTQPEISDTIKPTAHDWCWKQQSRVLIAVLYLASHWSHLCPILNIAWLHSYIGSLPYGLEVRYWLYYDVMARFLGTSKSCPTFLSYHRTEQE